jgi:hypothetical protein
MVVQVISNRYTASHDVLSDYLETKFGVGNYGIIVRLLIEA